MPEIDCDKPDKRKFKSHPTGYLDVDIAEGGAERGRERGLVLLRWAGPGRVRWVLH